MNPLFSVEAPERTSDGSNGKYCRVPFECVYSSTPHQRLEYTIFRINKNFVRYKLSLLGLFFMDVS